VEGKDGGAWVSPSLSLPLPIKTCAIVMLLMAVAGGPDLASRWVDLVPRRLDLALAAWGWCRRAPSWSVGFLHDSSLGTLAGGASGIGVGGTLPSPP
jgi:hypothetical protein